MSISTTARDYRSTSSGVLGSLLGLGFLVGAWPITVSWAAPEPLQLAPTLAHVGGMLAGYGVLVLMTFVSRWPVLERGVGSDRLARWHGTAGRVVVGLVVVHAVAAVVAWAQSRHENVVLATWHVIRLPWLISATVATVMLLAVAVVSARAARRRLSYEAWHGVHLSVYVAIALSFLHQLGGPDLAGHRVLQVAWALVYTHTFALVLRYRLVAPVRQATRHRLRVVAVVPEVPGVVSIVLRGRHLDGLCAEPGQFFRWRFLTPDTWHTANPFSLSAPPQSDWLRLTVKDLGGGSRLLQSIDVGTWARGWWPRGPTGR